MSRSIIVLPDDTAKPILEAINQAKKSIRVKMFLFSDPSLLDAVIAAQRRGVDVRIMLNPERRDGEKENADTRKKLTEGGVHVSDSNPAFDVTHEKSMVIDDTTAFVQSLNWETKNVTETRDYAVVTRHQHEVNEVAQCFDAGVEVGVHPVAADVPDVVALRVGTEHERVGGPGVFYKLRVYCEKCGRMSREIAFK